MFACIFKEERVGGGEMLGKGEMGFGWGEVLELTKNNFFPGKQCYSYNHDHDHVP